MIDAVGTCGCCCLSAASAAQGCPHWLWQDKKELLFWSSTLIFYSRLLSFTWSFFQQAHNFPWHWNITPDPDSKHSQGYLVPRMLLTWGMLLVLVCDCWNNRISSVWVVAYKICSSTLYSLYRLCFCWVQSPFSDCSSVKLCRIFFLESIPTVLLKINLFRKVTTPYSEDTFSMFCFSACLKVMIYTATVEQQM